MKSSILWAGAVALACAAVAQAANSETLRASPSASAGSSASSGAGERPYIAILPGYFYADKGYGHGSSRHGLTLSGIYGYPLSAHWAGEVNIFGTIIETDSSATTDFYQQGFTFDAVYNFLDRAHFTPYLVGGIGGAYTDVIPNSQDAFEPIANAGIGFVTGPLMEDGFLGGLKLRADARYVYNNFSFDGGGANHQDDARFSLGIQIPLGRATRPAPPPEVIIKKVRVEVPVPAPTPPPRRDTDGDGVFDHQDNCPSTLAGTRVDAQGCTIANQSVELHGVHFGLDKKGLGPNAGIILGQAIAAMRGQPSMTAQIDGYTDSQGSAAYNLRLSQERAQTVRQYLVDHGVAPGRLTARGFGETNLLVAPERTKEDYARNRRVEFRIKSQ